MMDINFKNAKSQIAQNGEIRGVTVGNSMFPLFRNNKDVVTIKKIDSNLKVNDVLLYRKKTTDEFILHRLLKITEDFLVIRGDNRYSKEFVAHEDIIGVMASFERNGKIYDCNKSFIYKLYVIYIRTSYPFRRLLRKIKSFFSILKRNPKMIIKKIFK